MKYINTEIYDQLIRDVNVFREISSNDYKLVYMHFKRYLKELGLSTKQKKFAKYPLALRRNAVLYAFKCRLREDITNIISTLQSEFIFLPTAADADADYNLNYYMNNFNYIRECIEKWYECLNIKVVELRRNKTGIVGIGQPVDVIWQRLADISDHDIDWRSLMHFANPTTTKNPTILYGWAMCSMSELDDLCLTIGVCVEDIEEQK